MHKQVSALDLTNQLYKRYKRRANDLIRAPANEAVRNYLILLVEWQNQNREHMGILQSNSKGGNSSGTRPGCQARRNPRHNDARGYRLLVNPELPEVERKQLEELAKQFEHAFAQEALEDYIKLATRYYNRRLATSEESPQEGPPKWEEEINKKLTEITATEPLIIRPSSSPWASDVVLVKKKDGSLRFAVDYRRLNAVTKQDEYRLPNPQSIFDKLQGSVYFSKLDVASSYWTIPIRPQEIEKNAFHTPRGLFEMIVMPFGLCNSQATFQRLMDQALGQLHNVESYVDDIIVYSNTYEEHVRHVTQVMECLEGAGLRLRKDKCQIGYQSIEFLGH